MDEYVPPPHSGIAAAQAGVAPPPPAKGLLLRVKRKRNEPPLPSLVVTSDRAEKRAALHDLRQSFDQATISATEANQAAQPSAAAATSTATTHSNAQSTIPATDSTAATGASAGSTGLFKAKPAASPGAPRVFKLLTTVTGPKQKHVENETIQQRIASLRTRRLATHSSALPSTLDVHARHLAAQAVALEERRSIRLEHNRDRLSKLGMKVPGSTQATTAANFVRTPDVQVKIVDVRLGGRPASKTGGGDARTSFAPPPLRGRELVRSERAAARRAAKQREAAASTVSSHGSVSGVDPQIAAQQFKRAMDSIKQMPPASRAQMDAYKGLIEDYLNTLPTKERDETQTQTMGIQRIQHPEQNVQVHTPSSFMHATQHQQTNEEAEASVAIPAQEPFYNRRAPKIPIRRRKQREAAPQPTVMKPPDAAAASAAIPSAAEPSLESYAGALPPVPVDSALSIMPTQEQKEATATAGKEDDESEYVYDVYHLPEESDDAAAEENIDGMTTPDHGGPAAVHTSHSLSEAGLPSSAVVYVRDGLLQWVGADGYDAYDDDGFPLIDDEDELYGEYQGTEYQHPEHDEDSAELSDYPDEPDTSDEERMESEERQRMVLAYHDDPGDTDFGQSNLSSHHHHQHGMRHFHQIQPAKHGYYPEEYDQDEEDEDEDEVVKEVRRAMRAGGDLSSSDDEDCIHYHPQQRDEAEDEEYVDTIGDEDMDEE